MKRFFDLAALLIVLFVALLITGVVDETYLLLSVALIGVPADVTAETMRRLIDGLTRHDWNSLGDVSAPLLRVAFLGYILRSLLYTAAAAFLLWRAMPYFRRIYASLKTLDIDDGLVAATADREGQRERIVAALRARAARKRVESYAFLGAALVSLAIAIGFVTRGDDVARPDALSTEATSTDEALARAETLVTEAREAAQAKLSGLQDIEREVLELARNELGKDDADRTVDAAKSNQAVLTALLARQPPVDFRETAEAAAVAKDYVGFARAQLDVINRQAEIEVIQHTVLAVAVKVVALILILALARVLVKLYQTGFSLAVQYEAIADALLVGPSTRTVELPALRDLFMPTDGTGAAGNVPSSTWDAAKQLLLPALPKIRPPAPDSGKDG